MDTSNPVLCGLLRKRQEIAGEIETLQANAATLFAALDNLDATIRLFAPDQVPDEISPKRFAARHAALPGQTSRVILDALRDAAESLTTYELAHRVMTSRGLDADNRNLFLTMQKRVLASLRNLRIREVVRADKRSGSAMRWRLATETNT